jgi:hypothetical protein
MAFGARTTARSRGLVHVAEGIAEWVIKQAAASSCDVVVIAARMPQELAVGLGIQLGQRLSSWPWPMHPAIYEQGQLVIPDLQLGGEAVPPQRTP